MQALKQSRTTPGQFANFKHNVRAAVTDVAGSTMVAEAQRARDNVISLHRLCHVHSASTRRKRALGIVDFTYAIRCALSCEASGAMQDLR
eukprot:86371-Pyramimonas_sp.AAC.1